MIESGLCKIPYDRRDYDFHKTFGVASLPAFPTEYSTDLNQWMPDQNAMGAPYGCTGFSGADSCADEDGVLYDPLDLYRATPPGRDGEGRDMRAMLDTLRKRGLKRWLLQEDPAFKRTAYFQIKASGFIDSFDAIRLAMLSTRDEHRAVIAGVPWYPEFQVIGQSGIMKMPLDFSLSRVSWHAVKIAGWTTINNTSYLLVKSWQGQTYGDRGWAYMPRELANVLLNISGAAAFTVTKVKPTDVQRVDFQVVAWIVSYVRSLLGLQ